MNKTPTPLNLSAALVESLAQIAAQIRAYLLKSERTIPVHLVEQLNLLAHGLKQLSQTPPETGDFSGDRATHNLVALAGLGQMINSSLQLNEVLRLAMDMIVRLTNAERGFLMLREQDGTLSMRVARNWSQETIKPSDFAISGTVVERVLNQGKAVLTTDAQEDPRFGGQESVVAYHLHSILCVPLKLKDQLIGVIYADHRIRSGIFTETELELLTAFANQAAVAIENARLFESTQRALSEATELKNLMDNVFASIASGVITTDAQGQVTLSNRAAQEMLARAGLFTDGNSLHELPPAILERLAQHLRTVRQSEQNLMGIELDITQPGETPVTLNLNISPLKDANHETQGVAIVLDDLTEKRRLQAQRRLFERMVSPAVIDEIDPEALHMGGRRTRLTTLFADIRGFTQFGEVQDPEILVTVLNRYLAAAAESILAQQGTIDKFLGDAVMAWFNAPIPQPDHARRAVQAALDMQRAVQYLHHSLPAEYRLGVAVGIHFGDVVLGLVGSEERLDYTAIGDSVNTAKRIQENAAAGQVLISAEVLALLGDSVEVRRISALQAKGKSQPVQVYEVIRLKD